jgi:hypothetical protein
MPLVVSFARVRLVCSGSAIKAANLLLDHFLIPEVPDVAHVNPAATKIA